VDDDSLGSIRGQGAITPYGCCLGAMLVGTGLVAVLVFHTAEACSQLCAQLGLDHGLAVAEVVVRQPKHRGNVVILLVLSQNSRVVLMQMEHVQQGGEACERNHIVTKLDVLNRYILPMQML